MASPLSPLNSPRISPADGGLRANAPAQGKPVEEITERRPHPLAPLSARAEYTDSHLESRREALRWAKGLVDAAAQGIDIASQRVASAHQAWQQPQPDQGRILQLGQDIINVARTAGHRGLYPLMGSQQMQFPEADVPSFRLIGSESDALVDPSGFHGDPQIAQHHLAAFQDNLQAARAVLDDSRDRIDRQHALLADEELAGVDDPHADIQRLGPASTEQIAAAHYAPDVARVVELLS